MSKAYKDKPRYASLTITAAGQYLLRIEHNALHVASSVGGAQFYISCAQINVVGKGAGNPSPTALLPGAYKATDPGILINIYYPIVSGLSFVSQ